MRIMYYEFRYNFHFDPFAGKSRLFVWLHIRIVDFYFIFIKNKMFYTHSAIWMPRPVPPHPLFPTKKGQRKGCRSARCCTAYPFPRPEWRFKKKRKLLSCCVVVPREKSIEIRKLCKMCKVTKGTAGDNYGPQLGTVSVFLKTAN